MDKLPLDFTQPSPKAKNLPEAQQIIDTLWQVISGLLSRIEELEEKLNNHSDNSSQPPSQDSPKQRAERERKKSTGRAQGAQPGHRKHQRTLLPETEVNRIVDYYPNGRCGCGGDIELNRYTRHQVFDLPEVRYTVVEHRCHQGQCQTCHANHRARLPDTVPSGQMGPGLVA